MAIVEDEHRARLLARAIASDIQLYNQDRIEAAAGGSLAAALRDQIDEGRQLFASRVVPHLHQTYEEVIAEFFGG